MVYLHSAVDQKVEHRRLPTQPQTECGLCNDLGRCSLQSLATSCHLVSIARLEIRLTEVPSTKA